MLVRPMRRHGSFIFIERASAMEVSDDGVKNSSTITSCCYPLVEVPLMTTPRRRRRRRRRSERICSCERVHMRTQWRRSTSIRISGDKQQRGGGLESVGW
ncbi:hypothetical protein Y032_0149g2682 [Ancylostoma ceylanicum]|uniref:Uncharacterized protein n=1 Tax=Ancylostoma ceylanicum TaxID=53326 RepID=A0A016T1J1_9BILA|nr:hypothetical protein Y032_0149g2682 [Ancylostoma ceylanicum]